LLALRTSGVVRERSIVLPKHLDLGDDDGCFACGKSNPFGLQLEFDMEGEEYVTYFTPEKRHQGYIGIVHGGIVSTVLDEVMARYVHILGENAVTGEMTVRFRRPALVGHKLRFAGRIEDAKSRLLTCSARATDEDGTLIAEATGKMVRVIT
jgi:uncharacterized protein (TIGR00369 family)